MKLLIAGAKPKFFHLREFGDALTKFNVDYKLVHDIEIYTGFPSKDIRNWFQSLSKFNNLVEEFKPDAVLVDRQNNFGLATLKANLPLFIQLRGDYWSEMKWAKETLYKWPVRRTALFLKDRIARKCFEGATAILPICKYLENVVKQYYPKKPTDVMYGGIDSSRWYTVSGMSLKHPSVGLLQGAWIWGKAREMLQLTNVLKAMPDVTFYWAGDGPYRENILSVLSKYDNFKWIGPLEYPDKVREYLAEIDVYALVSGIDMSPLTLQEAQLMEKPVVATNVGGIPELMVNEKTGFLVEKENPEQLIEKISILINDNKKAKQMGEAGRNYVKNNFSWDKIAEKFVSILDTYLEI